MLWKELRWFKEHIGWITFFPSVLQNYPYQGMSCMYVREHVVLVFISCPDITFNLWPSFVCLFILAWSFIHYVHAICVRRKMTKAVSWSRVCNYSALHGRSIGRYVDVSFGVWRLHLAPGKIVSPFLAHSTFSVRLQMVNYSGYG